MLLPLTAWLSYAPVRHFETQFLLWLSEHRDPLLNVIFIFFTLLGTEYFYMLLIPILFVIFERRKACMFASVILISLLVNELVKTYFCMPRPECQLFNSLNSSMAEGYSFPSGHAQGSMTLWGLIALHRKNSLKMIILCVSMIILISFSRLYLGVHYPLDIAGGWLIGGFILVVYWIIVKRDLHVSYWIPFSCLTLISLLSGDPRIQKIGTTLAGLYCGMLIPGQLSAHLRKEFPLLLRMACVLLGGGLIIGVGKITGLNKLVLYFCLGLWINFLFPYIVSKLTLRNRI